MLAALIICGTTFGWIAMGAAELQPKDLTLHGLLTMAGVRLVLGTELPLIQLLLGSFVGWRLSKTVSCQRVDVDSIAGGETASQHATDDQ